MISKKAQTLLSQFFSNPYSPLSSFNRLLRFLSVLCIFAILSCSGSVITNNGNSGNTGTIIISYRVPIGVYKVRAAILDTNNNPVSGWEKEKDATPENQ